MDNAAVSLYKKGSIDVAVLLMQDGRAIMPYENYNQFTKTFMGEMLLVSVKKMFAVKLANDKKYT
jgi:hypothetical protein